MRGRSSVLVFDAKFEEAGRGSEEESEKNQNFKANGFVARQICHFANFHLARGAGAADEEHTSAASYELTR